MKENITNHQSSSVLSSPSHFSAYGESNHSFVSGSGIYLKDSFGENYIDACSGTFNMGLGYGNSEIKQELINVLNSGILHLSSSFQSKYVREAEKALVEIAPSNIKLCHLKGSTGGSSAIEQAIRHVWVSSGKRTIVSFRGSHHGQTIATTFLSGMPFRRDRLPISPLPVLHVEPPDCYRCPFNKEPSTCNFECIDKIERALNFSPTGNNDIAAFIGEPIMGAGGGITPPHNYWSELHNRLENKGIPLVFDEVQTFGRTGHFFAAQYYNVDPNIIVVAKGISGIGVPAAGALLLEKKFALLNQGERSLTWGSNNLTCAAIETTIRVMSAPNFWESTREAGHVLNLELRKLERKYPFIGAVRGTGLMTGLEIVVSKDSKIPNNKLARKIINCAMKNKLIVRLSEYGHGSFVKVRPPLIISSSEVRSLCNLLDYSISQAIQQ